MSLSRPSLTRTSSFWFGKGSSKDERLNMISDGLTVVIGSCGMAAGAIGLYLFQEQPSSHVLLPILFDLLLPFLAGLALFVTILILFRVLAQKLLRECVPGAPEFGRKAILVTTSALLFSGSCFYRALNIADEGAATCRGAPTPFNAPAAGRFVATVGEIALVVQMSIFIHDTAERLGATQGLWSTFVERYTSIPFTTITPVLIAECMSWTGVLSGNSKFYCAEYVIWMIIAFTWAWDGAELMHKAQDMKQTLTFAGVMIGGLALFFFNAFLEIPHFFQYSRPSEVPTAGIWECFQNRDSPLWVKRLPFFVCYFVGAAWSSVAISHRFVRIMQSCEGRNTKRD